MIPIQMMKVMYGRKEVLIRYTVVVAPAPQNSKYR